MRIENEEKVRRASQEKQATDRTQERGSHSLGKMQEVQKRRTVPIKQEEQTIEVNNTLSPKRKTSLNLCPKAQRSMQVKVKTPVQRFKRKEHYVPTQNKDL